MENAEVPAANGHGNARSVAMIQGLISNGGEMNGVKILKQETIDLIFDEQSHGPDLVLLMPLRFGMVTVYPMKNFRSYLKMEKYAFGEVGEDH